MPLPLPPDEPGEVGYYVWEAYRPIYRVCAAAYQPNSFNGGSAPARFRPFASGDADLVPTMYGSNRTDGALGETVFHDAPSNGREWTVPRRVLYARVRAVLIPLRRLVLVDLTGWAHKALRLDGRALVDCGPSEYEVTAAWAQRFHALNEKPDGIYWRSRQYDRAHAFILFGDRVASEELHVVFDETLALWQGIGLDEVLAAAERASITITA